MADFQLECFQNEYLPEGARGGQRRRHDHGLGRQRCGWLRRRGRSRLGCGQRRGDCRRHLRLDGGLQDPGCPGSHRRGGRGHQGRRPLRRHLGRQHRPRPLPAHRGPRHVVEPDPVGGPSKPPAGWRPAAAPRSVRGLQLITSIVAREPGIKHVILLTDGKDEHESPETLEAAIEAAKGVFQCDCRGVGTDWVVSELRKIATALLGTVDIVADPAGLAADFETMMAQAMGKSLADVKIRLWTPQGASISFVKQVAPDLLDLTDRRVTVNPLSGDYPTGAWGDESRDYHFAVSVNAGQVGDEMLAARVSLGGQRAGGGPGPRQGGLDRRLRALDEDQQAGRALHGQPSWPTPLQRASRPGSRGTWRRQRRSWDVRSSSLHSQGTPRPRSSSPGWWTGRGPGDGEGQDEIQGRRRGRDDAGHPVDQDRTGDTLMAEAICPNGHLSDTADYCDQCGAKIGGRPQRPRPRRPRPVPRPLLRQLRRDRRRRALRVAPPNAEGDQVLRGLRLRHGPRGAGRRQPGTGSGSGSGGGAGARRGGFARARCGTITRPPFSTPAAVSGRAFAAPTWQAVVVADRVLLRPHAGRGDPLPGRLPRPDLLPHDPAGRDRPAQRLPGDQPGDRPVGRTGGPRRVPHARRPGRAAQRVGGRSSTPGRPTGPSSTTAPIPSTPTGRSPCPTVTAFTWEPGPP